MTIFLLKSILSLLLLVAAAYGMYSMYAVFGRPPDAERAGKRRRRHRIAGYVFAVLFFAVSYLCIGFAMAARSEPSPRAALHMLLALLIVSLFILKVLFVRQFRQFYEQIKIIGTVIGLLTFVLVGLTAGYFLAVSRFGQDTTVDRSASYALRGPFLIATQISHPGPLAILTDPLSIERGKTLFQARCAACHDPDSTRTIVGPGLEGILKRPKLPVSGHPTTAESIRFQLRQPLGRMPSFSYLREEEIDDLIAYLNTL
jgi:mono/diheme cytochrome c family protein